MKLPAASVTILKKLLPLVVGLVALVLVIAWLAGLMTEKIEPGAEEITAREFNPARDRTDQVHQVDKPYFEEMVGTVKASSRTEISARLMAPINKIHVYVGQMVQAGDVLIELDPRAFETELSRAKASLVAAQAVLKRAENDYERAAQLYQKKVINKAELDQRTADREVARAQLNQAEQEVAGAEVTLSYSAIKAPIAGLISDRWAEAGDTARPGVPLLVMYDPASMRLEVPVRENLAVHLKVGDELTMSIDVLGDELQAPIDEITGQAELASRSFLVKLTLPNHANLAEGMTGRVQIPAGIRRHLCLPIEAVQTIGQLNFVDVVRDDNTIERRFIQLGRFGYPGRIEVLSGVKAEELVLLRTARKTAVQDDG